MHFFNVVYWNVAVNIIFIQLPELPAPQLFKNKIFIYNNIIEKSTAHAKPITAKNSRVVCTAVANIWEMIEKTCCIRVLVFFSRQIIWRKEKNKKKTRRHKWIWRCSYSVRFARQKPSSWNAIYKINWSAQMKICNCNIFYSPSLFYVGLLCEKSVFASAPSNLHLVVAILWYYTFWYK